MASSRAARPPLSIRRAWILAIGIFAAVVVALGLGIYAFTQVERSAFERTVERMEQEARTLAVLDRRMLAAEVSIGGVVYHVERTGDAAVQWQQLHFQDRAVQDLFAALERSDMGDAPALARARAAWAAAVAGITAARDLSAETVHAALAQGEDPFTETVWQPLEEARRSLDALTLDRIAELGVVATEVEADQQRARIVLVIAAALVLLGASVAWTRLAHRVVRPLAALRDATVAVRSGGPGTVELPKGTVREIVELADALLEAHDHLRDDARTDPLTGLGNRLAITEVVEAHLDRAVPQPMALVLIDLDGFKAVNDTLGHAAGDELLRAVAGRLRSTIRGGDLAVRVGGDELALVVLGDDPVARGREVAGRAVAALAEPVAVEGGVARITASAGVAAAPVHATDLVGLFREADAALYAAKAAGKARVVVAPVPGTEPPLVSDQP